MMEFSLWKNLKKRLRRKRRPMWMLGCTLLGLFAGALYPPYAGNVSAAAAETPEKGGLIRSLEQLNKPVSVKLHRVYLCGNELKPLGRMTGNQVARLHRAHPDWRAQLDIGQSTVLFEQQVDDLSEHCKANAYFGVDKDGNLTLYDGAPKKEKVVRTFFQLDVRYMESSLPQDKLDELAGGIRVSDIDEYNSVLSTYSDYAIEKNEKVMTPAYQP
ncbi:BofC C-terminal domain-containing protein [Paenibacillus arenilitoris]|uniref:BofC C-terminal domain-containing protein n=1 Tax=Paenibacillus arenilitoris TaxID=2772299 RepID=A0A927CNA6_9BACL|nr:BofC C-terminal domain-containing protein [Paenibacillus arenilitoris]MBD2870432.1 BofC C-terminal domain-containing protein [Paenibacillus arenilitoris]